MVYGKELTCDEIVDILDVNDIAGSTKDIQNDRVHMKSLILI